LLLGHASRGEDGEARGVLASRRPGWFGSIADRISLGFPFAFLFLSFLSFFLFFPLSFSGFDFDVEDRPVCSLLVVRSVLVRVTLAHASVKAGGGPREGVGGVLRPALLVPAGWAHAWSIRGGRWGGAGSLAASQSQVVRNGVRAAAFTRISACGCTRADAKWPVWQLPRPFVSFLQRRNSELAYFLHQKTVNTYLFFAR